jgi:trimethylamine--corrinoid protein Co-methyltransferase
MIQRYMEPQITATTPPTSRLMRSKKSAGHFFGIQHTQDRYERFMNRSSATGEF